MVVPNFRIFDGLSIVVQRREIVGGRVVADGEHTSKRRSGVTSNDDFRVPQETGWWRRRTEFKHLG